jgi:hypothetical protein
MLKWGRTTALVLCTTLAITTALSAASQQAPNQKTRSPDKTAAADKRGTDAEPLTVKVLPSPNAEADSAYEKREREHRAQTEAEKTLVDKALVKWTHGLFWATFALAVIAISQVGLFVWQLRLIRKGTDDAGIAASAAKDAAEETRKSVELANREFVSSHRPKVILRRASLYIDAGDDMGADTSPNSGVAYVVANVGDTDATVVESNATVHVFKVRDKSEMGEVVFSADLPFSNEASAITNPMLTPGVAYTFVAHAPDNNVIRDKWGARAGYAKIVFLGYVIYEDANGVRRRTQFCREYEPTSERFIVADSEHDYAD